MRGSDGRTGVGDGRPASGRPGGERVAALPARLVAVNLAVLSAAAGCLDVVAVTRLGGPFASVITGNLVLLGRAFAQVDGGMVVDTSTAVVGYAVGVAGATLALGGGGPGWRRRTSVIAGAEAVLLLAVAFGWLASDAHPGRVVSLPMLGLGAAAMGAQSAVTLGTGVRGASTTYLTGTLTTVMRVLVRGPHRLSASGGGAVRLAALLAGAAAGGLLLRFAPLWAPALAAALVAVVVVVATAGTR